MSDYRGGKSTSGGNDRGRRGGDQGRQSYGAKGSRGQGGRGQGSGSRGSRSEGYSGRSSRGDGGDDRGRGKREWGGRDRGRNGAGRGWRDDRKFGAPKRNRSHQGEFKSHDPNEPLIPAGVVADDLDKEAMKALATLSGANKEIVARHLVAAGQLIDVDPQLAYEHAQAAVKRAGRVDVTREAAALTAYATGRYEEALREVRAVRRMRGDNSLCAIEADCERGLGRPERAVAIMEETDLASLPLEEQVELILVVAGARADLDQMEYSLMIIENALDAMPPEADSLLRRRLMLLQIERLRDLGREEDAARVEEALPEEEDPMEIVDLGMLLDADVDNIRTDLRGSDKPLNEIFDGALLDLDGVCYHGGNVQPGGPEALTEALDAGMTLGFVTNNASIPPQAVAEKLTSMGYEAEARQVMTAAVDLLTDLREAYPDGATVLVVGSSGLADLLRESGFSVVFNAENPVDAVVQGFGPEVDWALMTEGAYAISAGATYYATNLDATLPTERGFALGNGALVAAVVKATGKRPISAGKPRPEIFLRAAAMIGSEKPICVGDRLETDIAGAIAARMAGLHVLTGVHQANDIINARKGMRPSFVGLGLEALNEIHPRPLHHRDNTWTCGVSQVVKIARHGIVEIGEIGLAEDGAPVTVGIDTYRALVAAAWHYADENQAPRCPQIIVVSNEDEKGIITEPNYEAVVERPQPQADEEITLGEATGPSGTEEDVVSKVEIIEEGKSTDAES